MVQSVADLLIIWLRFMGVGLVCCENTNLRICGDGLSNSPGLNLTRDCVRSGLGGVSATYLGGLCLITCFE